MFRGLLGHGIPTNICKKKKITLNFSMNVIHFFYYYYSILLNRLCNTKHGVSPAAAIDAIVNYFLYNQPYNCFLALPHKLT